MVVAIAIDFPSFYYTVVSTTYERKGMKTDEEISPHREEGIGGRVRGSLYY